MAAYVLSRATAHDLDEIVLVQYEAFKSAFVRRLFMGCESLHDLPKLAKHYAEEMQTDPTDIWIKITDSTSGAIVAASNWKIYLGSAEAQARTLDKAMPWLEGEVTAEANDVLQIMNVARLASNADPFIHLHILFTSPDHLRKGIGSMMMRWGCELADLCFLPSWIEASPEGNFLYKKFGFIDQQQLVHNGEVIGTCMRRESRADAGAVATSVPKAGGIDFGVL